MATIELIYKRLRFNFYTSQNECNGLNVASIRLKSNVISVAPFCSRLFQSFFFIFVKLLDFSFFVFNETQNITLQENYFQQVLFTCSLKPITPEIHDLINDDFKRC